MPKQTAISFFVDKKTLKVYRNRWSDLQRWWQRNRQGRKWLSHKTSPHFPFLQYSNNRELRHELYNAYINRGNNGNEYDNNKVLAEIVSLRAKRAKLLGYKTHADFVLEPRMAKNPGNVLNLLNGLWEKSIPVARKEVVDMQAIINREGGKFKLEPSDWWYYAEKLRKAKYDLDDTELRPYFRLENVRDAPVYVQQAFREYLFTITGISLHHPEVGV